MQDGFFLDHHTQNVKMSLLAFNGDAKQFLLTEVTFTFESAGVIDVDSRISMFRRWPYETPLDIFRLVLEIVFCVLVFYQVFAELRELGQAVRESESCCQGVCAYLSDFSNSMDWISMAITVIVIVNWIRYFLSLAQFNPRSRYPVYIPTPTEHDCKSARCACQNHTMIDDNPCHHTRLLACQMTALHYE